MYILGYDGLWRTASARHPESFTELAPEGLQRICRIFGGTRNWHGEPLFRLAVVSSRYQLVGGQQVTIRDDSGNYIKQIPTECFIPRYHVKPEYHSAYVLEMWHSAQWYWEHGWGANQTENAKIETDIIKTFRGDHVRQYTDPLRQTLNMEPVWPDGGYEAIEKGVGDPFIFPRNYPDGAPLNTELIQWGIFIVHLRMGMDAGKIIAHRKQKQKEQEAKERQQRADFMADKRPAFMEPTVSYAGISAP